MKTRQGFVSNSSSSSYLIYGMDFDIDELRKLIHKDEMTLENINKKLKAENIDDSYESIDELIDDLGTESIDLIFNDEASEVSINGHGQFEYGVAIGCSPEKCPDNMTMGEWKKKIEKAISSKIHIPADRKFGWLEYAWYDG